MMIPAAWDICTKFVSLRNQAVITFSSWCHLFHFDTVYDELSDPLRWRRMSRIRARQSIDSPCS